MKKLKKELKFYLKIIFSFLFITIFSTNVLSNEIFIKGNNFTDKRVILSLIENKPIDASQEYSNYIIKVLDKSALFENVTVEIVDNDYIVTVTEYFNINNIYFNNNDRLKDDELLAFADELNLKNLNPSNIDNYINEIQKLYESFGYNNINITYTEKKFLESNTADLIFDINEGSITKIKNIFFTGNVSIDNDELKSIIKSKTKTLINLFANNNFKKFTVENDVNIIEKYYRNKGFIDVNASYSIEYLKSNSVNIYFNITENNLYLFKDINILDDNNLLTKDVKSSINGLIKNSISLNETYSFDKVNLLKSNISDLIIKNGIEYFEVKILEKKDIQNISILYNITSIKPKYANQINIYGNSRTFDRVIRRELEISEGDAIYDSQLDRIRNKLSSLRLFKSVEVIEKEIDENLVNLEINVEETQTGTLNAGVSIGTIEGLGVVAGLSERNFYGTGRSLKALVNTTNNKTQFTLETTDRLFYENDVDVSFRAKLKDEDFAKTSSYKLQTFSTGFGIGYKINPKLRHSVDLDYIIKDYNVTNSSTVATAIEKSSGENISFVLKNNVFFNTLNSLMIPKNGRYISFTNLIETPTSSSNGTVKNLLTFRNYNKFDKNIFSYQAKLGNIISLNNNDILTDDKFSLGGRWLRGFDTFGAGPRDSRTSYVGGNNLITTKFDFAREITNNSDFPVYANIFNDYGLVWENKTKPINNDNSLRSSVGFGLKYYSPIGPIGFSWGFPLLDESYDIKRMFLFSIGNID